MVKTEEKLQADEGHFGHAQETNDVGRWQEENCRSAKS
jgi:hypothetical protein